MALDLTINFLSIDQSTKTSTITEDALRSARQAQKLIQKKRGINGTINPGRPTTPPALPPYYLSRIPLQSPLHNASSPFESTSLALLTSLLFSRFPLYGSLHFLSRAVRSAQKTTIQTQAKASEQTTVFMGPSQEPPHLQADRRVTSARPVKKRRR